MKVIIAGGRDFTNTEALQSYLHALHMTGVLDITEDVCGEARGADKTGAALCESVGIPVTRFPAEWDKYGKRAGYLRNEQMGDYADVLVACWDGQSRGTKHMIDYMTKLGKPVYILPYK